MDSLISLGLPRHFKQKGDHQSVVTYLDSGGGDRVHTLGGWLETHLTSDVKEVRILTAYFSPDALRPFLPILSRVSQGEGIVRLVIGANQGQLTRADLQTLVQALDLQSCDRVQLIVVSFNNALFHPKVFHLVRMDGSAVAAVGSANLTVRGMGTNVESMLCVDSPEDGDLVLRQIAEAIDFWSTTEDEGVFRVSTQDDIDGLEAAGIVPAVRVPPPPPATPSRQSAPPGGGADPIPLRQGIRRRLWTPPSQPQPPEPSPTTASTVRPHPTQPSRVPTVARWSKVLSASDALKVRPGTNPTGKLRLGKAGNPIDHKTFFRNDLFGSATWVPELRDGHHVDVAHIPFHVTINGMYLGLSTLTVDHGEHRIADQGNVPTVLAWGSDMGRELARDDYSGATVEIRRDANGEYYLEITS